MGANSAVSALYSSDSSGVKNRPSVAGTVVVVPSGLATVFSGVPLPTSVNSASLDTAASLAAVFCWACDCATDASRRLALASNGAVAISARPSNSTSAGLFCPASFCPTNSPPAPPATCILSSLPHAARVAFLAALPASLPSAISALAGAKNLPAKPIVRPSSTAIGIPRLSPCDLILAIISGFLSASATSLAFSMSTS